MKENSPSRSPITPRVLMKLPIITRQNSKAETDKSFAKQSKSVNKNLKKRNRDIEAYFLGHKAENINFFEQLIQKAIKNHKVSRNNNSKNQGKHITREMKNQKEFVEARNKLEKEFNQLLAGLRDLSIPFYSPRYFAHMAWQTSIPSMLGYFAAMLSNPNTCSFESAPLTTILEIQCINRFAKMYGYHPITDSSAEETKTLQKKSWGHLTSGGNVANCQSIWAARNLRYLPLAIRKCLEQQKDVDQGKSVKVLLPNGKQKELLKLTRWQITNIENEETFNLYERVFRNLYNLPEVREDERISSLREEFKEKVMSFSIGIKGFCKIEKYLMKIPDEGKANLEGRTREDDEDDDEEDDLTPQILISASQHYSIPKSTSILGFGEEAVKKIEVDKDLRMDTKALRKHLQCCLNAHVPVLQVVSIMGSTKESAVDPLSQILELREEFKKKGMYFHIHVDGAYGAYFTSMVHNKKAEHWNSLSEYTTRQLKLISEADSITFDPHKTGYVPYACGGIIYKDSRLKDQLNFHAPVIYDGKTPNMSIYGIEGSRPGNVAAGLYISLSVMPLERSGHGELLERTLMNTKIFCASLYELEKKTFSYFHADRTGKKKEMKKKLKCLPLPRRYTEEYRSGERDLEDRAYEIIAKTEPAEMERMIRGSIYEKFYLHLGPDLNIVCFSLNFSPNASLRQLNLFNQKILEIAKPSKGDSPTRLKELYLSDATIHRNGYKQVFDDFLQRHGLTDDDDRIVLIRSSIMNAFFTELEEDEGGNHIFLQEISKVACKALLNLSHDDGLK